VLVRQSAAKTRVKRGTAQQHLLDSAQRLFADRGYRGTTTKDIAQAAGVSEVLIFRYFGSKSELMVASVVSPLFAVLERFSEDWRRNDAFRAMEHQEIVHRFVSEVVDLIDSHHWLARAILNVLVERPSDFEAGALGERLAALLTRLSPEIAEFLSRRELTSANPALVLRMGIITAITNVVLLPELHGADEQAPAKGLIVDELTNFIVYGLQQAPQQRAQ
jgi:AcrR family transcriptional regulator